MGVSLSDNFITFFLHIRVIDDTDRCIETLSTLTYIVNQMIKSVIDIL